MATSTLYLKPNAPEAWRSRGQIRGYFGLNGSGKTFGAVLDLLPELQGRKWECSNPGHRHTARGETTGYYTVVSNIPLASPHYRPFKSYGQLLSLEHAIVFADEIQGVFGSSTASDLPVQIKNWLHQLRRSDLLLVYTGIAFARTVKELREVTKVATFARGYLPMLEPGQTWPSNHLFYYLSYDASELEAMALSDTRKVKPKMFQFFRRLWNKKAKAVEQYYSTFNSVSSFNSELQPVGVCLFCGGTKRRKACSCPETQSEPEEQTRHLACSPDAAEGNGGLRLSPPPKLTLK